MSEHCISTQSPETLRAPGREAQIDIPDNTQEAINDESSVIKQADRLKAARADIEGILIDTYMPIITKPNVDSHPSAPELSYKGTDREHLARPSDTPVEVDGRIMNVNIQGDGDKIIVLLQGRGTTAPAYDFAPLIDALKHTYRVVTPELFGSGLSDMTDKPRTNQQITAEIHQALQQLDINEFILVGHSLAGTQAIEYADKFRSEIKGFVGIDTATPHMSRFVTPELEQESSPPREPLIKRIINKVGLTRLASRAMPSLVIGNLDKEVTGHHYSRSEKSIMRELYFRNKDNDDIFESIKDKRNPADTTDDSQKFPINTPVHFFLSKESVDLTDRTAQEPWYIREHAKQIPNNHSDYAGVTVLAGEHYLHHTQAAAIAEGIKKLSD